MSEKSAVIIGAGITGLTAAYYLRKAGWTITILERDSQAGGSIRTFRENGFIFESGPNTGVVSQPEVVELFERLPEPFRFEPANEEAKRRLIWKKCRWHALPGGLKDGISTPLFQWKDKFRILLEPFRKKGTDPNETLDKLVRRRLGDSFLDYAVDPFILGIYAGDPSRLVTRYAMPKLYRLEQEYGSFIKGSIKKAKEPRTEEQKKVTKQLFSIEGGLENLTNALVREIGEDSFVFNCEKLSVYPKDGLFSVSYVQDGISHELREDVVITTTGAHEVPSILPFLNSEEKATISDLLYARVVQVAVGFKNWRGIPLRAFGGLVPSKENRKILGVLFPSAFLNNRAPEGGAILSVFLGGVRNPGIVDLDDATIKDMVMEELRCMMLICNQEPDLIKVFRHTHAIPQYGVSTGKRLDIIAKIESQFPGLIIGGNLRDGIGMADRIKQGTQIAKQLIEKSELQLAGRITGAPV